MSWDPPTRLPGSGRRQQRGFGVVLFDVMVTPARRAFSLLGSVLLLGSVVAGCSRIDYKNPEVGDIPRLVIEAYNDVVKGFDIRDLKVYQRWSPVPDDYPALRAIRDLVLTHPDGLLALVWLYGNENRELRTKAVLVTQFLLELDAISFRDLPRGRLNEVVAILRDFRHCGDPDTQCLAKHLLEGIGTAKGLDGGKRKADVARRRTRRDHKKPRPAAASRPPCVGGTRHVGDSGDGARRHISWAQQAAPLQCLLSFGNPRL